MTTPSAPEELGRAERALHSRMTMACAAARDGGLPGSFRTWEQDGLRAVLATDPALAFLSTVGGVAQDTVAAAVQLTRDPRWAGVSPKLLVQHQVCDEVGPTLRAAGFTRTGERVVAVRRLGAGPVDPGRPGPHVLEIVDADTADTADTGDVGTVGPQAFSDVLLAGYRVDGPVAAFIAAEHRHAQVRRFFAVEHRRPLRDLYVFRQRQQRAPIAAAAMTVHDDVAVLGGAGTLPEHRGRGAQSALLRHRLGVATRAGCSWAVATAAPDSSSERNLLAAGFRIHRHLVWQQR